MGRVEGTVALISGAASGIGAASARRLAEEGATVMGFDRQEPVEGQGWAETLAASPGSCFQAGVDVRDAAEIEALVARTVAGLGPIDILVNSAGVGGNGPAHRLAEEDWDRTLDINLKGSFLVTKYVLPSMMEKRSGSIIHIASTQGLEGMQGALSYNASKGGVVLMTRSMALDYGPVGIRVNCVCPGIIETPLSARIDRERDTYRQMIAWHALERPGTADEVANAVLFLACNEASFVTGHALVVDGGWTAGRRFV